VKSMLQVEFCKMKIRLTSGRKNRLLDLSFLTGKRLARNRFGLGDKCHILQKGCASGSDVAKANQMSHLMGNDFGQL
jgi:hypothetical protein